MDKIEIMLIFVLGFSVALITVGFTIGVIAETEEDRLMDYSEGYVEEVSKYYNFNPENIGRDMSIEEVKIEGGICKHYAEWYVNLAKEDGYNAEPVKIYCDNYGHQLAIAWECSDTEQVKEYCIMDNKELLGCIEVQQV